jgi:hypothetical protein
MTALLAQSSYYEPTFPFVVAGASTASMTVASQWHAAQQHFASSVSRESIESKFSTLAATWRDETQFASSPSDILLNASYQRIIGLGKPVVPVLLCELIRRPDDWFWALHSITGVNPVDPVDAGNVNKMALAWLDWGRRQGILA